MHSFKMIAAAAAAAGAIALANAPAQAATISLGGGTAGAIPDSAQKRYVLAGLGFDGPLAGFFGSSVSVIGSSPLRVEFLGFEAGYANTFTLDGGGFSTETIAPDNKEVFATPPAYLTGGLSGLLEFVFATSGGGKPSSITNGANPTDNADGPTGVNFFASIVGAPTATSGRSVMLFFDDNGANNDDDHDDMVVRLSVVPVPASLPLLLGALAGLGFISRRRRSYATV